MKRWRLSPEAFVAHCAAPTPASPSQAGKIYLLPLALLG